MHRSLEIWPSVIQVVLYLFTPHVCLLIHWLLVFHYPVV